MDVQSAALPKFLCPSRVIAGYVSHTSSFHRGIIFGCLPPLALPVLIQFIPVGAVQLPHLVHLQIPAWSLLLSLARRCLQKGAWHDWKQERCVETWLLAEGPESVGSWTQFCVTCWIGKLLWLTLSSSLPFCTKCFGCPRSRRQKQRCSWAISYNLSNMPLANLRGSLGPGAMIWLSRVLNYGSLLQVVKVTKMGFPPSTYLHREKRRFSLLLRSQRLFATSLLRL